MKPFMFMEVMIKTGNLTKDPAAIIESRRPLPIGYWKGAGLSLLLDLLATILSAGLSTHEISKEMLNMDCRRYLFPSILKTSQSFFYTCSN
jgi:LDH2 family malate/lactate/ureidoglycolate dehydrogenase